MKISGEVTHIFFETHSTRVHNKFPTHYALFFFYEKKDVLRESLSDRSCFEDKN